MPHMNTITTPAGNATALLHRRILVVDDNPDSADSLAMLIELLGAQVRVARNGLTALAEIDAFHPDVVLLDIGMPGMDGFEVARRIRSRTDSDAVMLIALTGWGLDEHRERTKESGFNHHLLKPVNMDVLHGLLSNP